METTLAILMVIGIFGVFPLVVGFTVAGAYILGSRLNRRIQRAKDNKELTIETLNRELAEANTLTSTEEPIDRRVLVA